MLSVITLFCTINIASVRSAVAGLYDNLAVFCTEQTLCYAFYWFNGVIKKLRCVIGSLQREWTLFGPDHSSSKSSVRLESRCIVCIQIPEIIEH